LQKNIWQHGEAPPGYPLQAHARRVGLSRSYPLLKYIKTAKLPYAQVEDYSPESKTLYTFVPYNLHT
jgi:hypothetical protein